MVKFKFLTSALVVAAMLVPSFAVAKTTLKVAHGAAESVPMHAGLVKFKEILEKNSNGEFEVVLYGNSQLGADRELTEAAQLGNIDIVCVSTANAAPFNKDFFIFDTPFLFKDRTDAYAVLDGPAGQAVLKNGEGVNLKGLGYMENGFRDLTNSDKEIRTPADLAGIKLRTMENPIQIAAWKALGANPTPMAFGELFTALQQKTVDGQENPMELIYSTKFFEVQPFITKTQHIYSPYAILASLESWEGYSKEEQAMIQDAMKQAIDYQRSIVVESSKKAEDAIKANGNTIISLTDAELAQFKEKVKSVLPMIKERVSPEIYSLFIEKK